MKFYCLLALPFLLFSISSGYSQKEEFSIEGHTPFKSGVAKLFFYNVRNELVPYDSASIKNGKFLLQGRLAEPELFLLQFGKQSRLLYIWNEYITISQKDSLNGTLVVTSKRKTQRTSNKYFENANTRSVHEEPILDNIHSAGHEPE